MLQQNLESALLRYLQDGSWEGKKQIILHSPDLLLHPALDGVVVLWIARWQERGVENKVEELRFHRALFRRCREWGVEAAFAWMFSPRIASLRAAVLDLFAARGVPARMEVLRSCEDAFADAECATVVDDFLLQSEDSTAATDYYREVARFFEVYRESGMDAALERGRGPRMRDDDARIELIDLTNQLEAIGPHGDGPTRVRLCRLILGLLDHRQYDRLRALQQANLADALLNLPTRTPGDIEESIRYSHLALEYFLPETDLANWVRLHVQLGYAYVERLQGVRADNLEQAIDYFDRGLQAATRDGCGEEWAESHLGLAAAYNRRVRGPSEENFRNALKHAVLALEEWTRENAPDEWARVRVTIGNAYSNRIQGDPSENVEQAIRAYEQASEICPDASFESATVHRNLALACKRRLTSHGERNTRSGIDHCLTALAVYTRERYPILWAETQNILGGLYHSLRECDANWKYERTLECFQGASEVLSESGTPALWAMVQMNLASVLADRGKGTAGEEFWQALGCCENSLRIYTRETSPAQWALAHLSIGLLQAAVGQPHLDAAVTHFRLVLGLSGEDLPLETRYNALQGLGTLQFERGEWSSANETITAAIQLADGFLSSSFTEAGRREAFRRGSRAYVDSSYCLLRLGRPVEALQRLELGKARLLADALVAEESLLESLPEGDRPGLAQAGKTVRALEAQIRSFVEQTDRPVEREMTEALRDARARLHSLSVRCARPPQGAATAEMALQEIVALIPRGGVFLFPLSTRQGGAVFVLPHGLVTLEMDSVILLEGMGDDALQPFFSVQADEKSWFALYDKWRRTHTGESLREWATGLEQCTGIFWDILLGPLHEKLHRLGLEQDAPVCIFPQGLLWLLPLHAAWRTVDGRRQCFADLYTVTYAPSAHLLKISQRRARETRRQAGTLVAVIDPTRDLPNALAEGLAVAETFDAGSRHSLEGENATLEAVERAVTGRCYLHFACHGHHDATNALSSALKLADRDLTMNGITNGSFDMETARLVTLSACETGMIEVSAAISEYVGLPGAFLQAGAPAVISSLWAVSDLSTALLMGKFYRNHRVGGQPLATALRDAQRWLRGATNRELGLRAGQDKDAESRPFAHPIHWAAFTLTGA